MEFRHHRSIDARDKIYALLGLANEPGPTIQIDYAISPEQLWERAVAHICRAEWRGNDLYNLKNKIHNLAKSMTLDIPSEKMSRCIETYFLAREPGRWLRRLWKMENTPKEKIFIECPTREWNPQGRFAFTCEPGKLPQDMTYPEKPDTSQK
ncbi:hypothetical protein E8E11_010256 [Didymella keratinophila]|nr:hypothetical protein E8E11_010256 [Didymella keratinophila]